MPDEQKPCHEWNPESGQWKLRYDTPDGCAFLVIDAGHCIACGAPCGLAGASEPPYAIIDSALGAGAEKLAEPDTGYNATWWRGNLVAPATHAAAHKESSDG